MWKMVELLDGEYCGEWWKVFGDLVFDLFEM